MRAVDTNVLVRLITRDDPDQTASAEEFVSKGAWVSTLVLTEALWVLASVYKINPAGQAKAVEMLLNHRHLTIQHHETAAAALALFEPARASAFPIALSSKPRRKPGISHLAPSTAIWRVFPALNASDDRVRTFHYRT